MKCQSLYEEFRRFEGQPVKIYTDDEKVRCGIDLVAYEDAVRIIDDCGRTILVEYEHIDAVVEPKMRLMKCCHDHCKCEEDEEDGRHDDDEEEEECERGERRREHRRY